MSLADVASITHSILLRALRPLGPANLIANEDGVAPTCAYPGLLTKTSPSAWPPTRTAGPLPSSARRPPVSGS
ncbi:MAG: hypothetical protein M5U12_37660 [Verrucomicrobia bacterium]|nr:hypothetical protein [Verrucomicrobiota bacterium]